ncbi:MAG: glycosyl hydrolase [Flavobacteriales bacterium]|nr:glycosyl hydrolase [Flavobacteriales bacterium]
MRQLTYLFLFLSVSTIAQTKKGNTNALFTPASEREQAMKQHLEMEKNSLFDGIAFRSVGPSIMSGRVVDIEVDPSDATHFFVAYATGGLWETKNNGTSFECLSDKNWMFGIGDIAIDWKSGRIYLGTGENNSSRSSYSGTGLYISDDHGKTWNYSGLNESHHIGRILLHPGDANTIWVSVLGHLFTPNKERGVYKSTDGGKSWKQTLFIDENTGVIDMAVNPQNPNELYASAWHRERRAWNFVESGASSGIYKSSDGGENWKKITNEGSGFPTGEGVGRIGISICKSKPETIYALLDNQAHRVTDKKEVDKEKLSKDELKKMSKDEFLLLNDKKINTFLRENGFPKSITVELVKEKIKKNEIAPSALAEYLEDANSLLFDTPVIGAEIYRSDDGGKSWRKTHNGYIDDLVYTYGYYFGQILADEKNPDKFYVAAFVIITSEDGGKTLKSINRDNVHVDHHAIWSDPNKAGHLINGNDGGINISYDNGEHWIKCNQPSVGQFYTVNVDMDKPYNIYGGLQDNGVWTASSQHYENVSWHQEGVYGWKNIMGGDGMQVMIDPRDNNTVYTGYQYGNYFRINKTSGESFYMTPKHQLGERPLRWNWQAPIWLSEHSADVVYMGANKMYRSLKQGEDFVCISPDLTKGGKPGDVAFGTITAIHESPLKFGLLYAGTDDGNIWVSKDAGTNWKNISSTLPADFNIRKIQASRFKEGRVYVCLNGHTRDLFASMIYVSEDYGTSWKKIGNNLPAEPINVIKEDVENENLIFVGSDHGLYASLDRGEQFYLMTNGLPKVPVHDLVIHPRDHDIIIATHGRSVYVASIEELQSANIEILASALHVFPAEKIRFSKRWGSKSSYWDEAWKPSTTLRCWVKEKGKYTLNVQTENGTSLFTQELELEKGFNAIPYSLECNLKDLDEKLFFTGENKQRYLTAGKYILQLKSNSAESKTELEIEEKK